MGFSGSTSAWQDCGSTVAFSTSGLGAMLGMSSGIGAAQAVRMSDAEYQRRMIQQLGSSPFRHQQVSGQFTTTATAQTTVKKGSSMVDEFKSYVREYKDWIFTIAIIAIIDHFFLDGALKDKLSVALGKKLDGANEVKGA